MSYGISNGFGNDLGYGGGARLLHFTQSQVIGMKTTAYIYHNVGIAAASTEDTEDGHMYVYNNVGYAPSSSEDTEDSHLYVYENVGYAPSSNEDTEDGIVYLYKNVQSRPGGSKEMLPPTHN